MTAERITPSPKVSLLEFFGAELRRLRTKASWAQGELASAAHTTQSMICKIERARQVPSIEMSESLDAALATDGHFARLHPLVLAYAYPAWFLPYVEMEREATAIRVFQGQVVPGLLQTEEYARALLSSRRPDSLDDLVTSRLSRQEVLEGSDRPRAWFVLDEQVLRRRVGNAQLMRGQLERLLSAGSEPRTVVQVIPESRGVHAGLDGNFSVLTSVEADVLHVDGFFEGRLSIDPSETAEALHAYDLLRADALPPCQSADLIHEYLRGQTTWGT
ncbi:helix-turn-helix domain-containing protein [Streptomyces bohaiensis]|uniref:Helix-turn-helix domain-containing protein n=1 Tax=Streptomyces bohaiensis TaxID=1431344 RepID=A0ABX1C891_9ACTN|nr:helix-turn-helix transcriptional regulator [Streptomyces bohaiensis]NJQ14456.1 helix-turn-helix domain-containing protein [Streptomyces bohaiensis]